MLKPLKVAPAVKKIFQRVMTGTKGAAKALQGDLNDICGHDACFFLPIMEYIVTLFTCRKIQGVQEVNEIAIS